MTTPPRRRVSRRLAVAATAFVTSSLVAGAVPAGATGSCCPRPGLAFRGEATLPAGLESGGTEVGGLSSITYDAGRNVYYAISDARPGLGQGPWRFYTLAIRLGDGRLDPGDVTVVAVTALTDPVGVPFPNGTVDPEGIALTRAGTLMVTSEGFSVPATTTTPAKAVAPWVREFGLDGRQLRELDLPAYVDPVPNAAGVRNNLGPESAAVTRWGRMLFTGFENALVQDGPAATQATGSPARLQRFDARSGRLQREYVYVTEPVAQPPDPPDAFSVNGLVELLPLTPHRLLAMERSFSVGAGHTVRLYRVGLARATDVKGVTDLDSAGTVRPAGKRLLVDLQVLGLPLDNLEGMTLGPRLRDGGRALLLVSDNNFAPGQASQFLLFSARGVGR